MFCTISMLLLFVASVVAAGFPFPDRLFPDSPPSVSYKPLPFPSWLTQVTGLKEWPGMEPPYVKMDFLDLKFLPKVPIHKEGHCLGLDKPDICLFDCHSCVSPDDVSTCPRLSQSFDDGPLPFTPTLVEALKSPSTFFTIGMNVVTYPDIYKSTADKGNIMGCHTWSHAFLPSLTNEQIAAQLQWSIWAMNATYGHLPKWFRPPYGGVDNRVRAISRQFGMQAVLWDYDTFDWRLSTDIWRLDKDVCVGVAKFSHKTGGRGLILEHDSVERTVRVGAQLNLQIPSPQMTVPQCVGGIDYIRTYPRPQW